MNLSLMLACIWAVAANVLAMIPSKDNHWARAYFLIAVGIPILGYVTYENGPWIGLLVLAAAMSLLRWPVIYLARWARGLFGSGKEQP
jgi:membrane protease YdiL (CAAX protease family)